MELVLAESNTVGLDFLGIFDSDSFDLRSFDPGSFCWVLDFDTEPELGYCYIGQDFDCCTVQDFDCCTALGFVYTKLYNGRSWVLLAQPIEFVRFSM